LLNIWRSYWDHHEVTVLLKDEELA